MRNIFILFLMAFTVLSCEKAVLPEENDNGGGGKNSEDGTDTTIVKPPTGDDAEYISVDSAIKLPNSTFIEVKGYIVGAATVSINYAVFTVPTDYTQSIIIADKPDEMNADHLLTVCLTDRSAARKDLNLHDNESNYHRLVILSGQRVSYLRIHGMNKLSDYQFTEK
jgi:hypothetical protein